MPTSSMNSINLHGKVVQLKPHQPTLLLRLCAFIPALFPYFIQVHSCMELTFTVDFYLPSCPKYFASIIPLPRKGACLIVTMSMTKSSRWPLTPFSTGPDHHNHRWRQGKELQMTNSLSQLFPECKGFSLLCTFTTYFHKYHSSSGPFTNVLKHLHCSSGAT